MRLGDRRSRRLPGVTGIVTHPDTTPSWAINPMLLWNLWSLGSSIPSFSHPSRLKSPFYAWCAQVPWKWRLCRVIPPATSPSSSHSHWDLFPHTHPLALPTGDLGLKICSPSLSVSLWRTSTRQENILVRLFILPTGNVLIPFMFYFKRLDYICLHMNMKFMEEYLNFYHHLL